MSLVRRAGEDDDGQIAEALVELRRLGEEAAELAAAGPVGTDVVPASGRRPPEAKAAMVALRADVVRKQAEITAKQAQLEQLMRSQLEQARRALEPLQKMAGRLEEGIQAVNLYLGRDEEIVLLADGGPAPANEPITVRQLVLAMDQECAVAAEEGGIDAVDIEEFDRWLLEDPAHLAQVLPEPKGVVALVPRWDAKIYEDPWKTAEVSVWNRQTYFLVRNGDRLFRTTTDFFLGRRLVPAATEFTSFFEGRRYNPVTGESERAPLEPGSPAWQAAEERADARRRHFMRVALILQGLVDRTTVFHPLPPEGVGFLDEAHYDAGRVRIVMDAEPALGTGQETFRAWQRRLNAELRPGMRIVGAFNDTGFGSHRHERGNGHERLSPNGASYPRSGELHAIVERRTDGGLVFRYERTDEVWDPDVWRESPDRPGWGWRGEYRRPKTRASCVVYPDDDFVVPFDLAALEDMARFLRARTERHRYVAMFPVLKAAIAAKRAEAVAEEPFRQMLAGILAMENGVGVPEAVEAVPGLVEWWKLANRHHRPLVGGEDAKAVRGIVAEHARRLRDERRSHDPEVLACLRAAHPEALVVARKRDGSWVVLSPQQEEVDVFVRELAYSAAGELLSTDEWKLPGSRPVRWTVLHESDRWRDWDRSASLSEHLTDPELDAFVGQVVAERREDERLLAVTHVRAERKLKEWSWRPGRGTSSAAVHVRTRHWRRTTGRRAVLSDGNRWPSSHPWGERTRPWEWETVLWVDAEVVAQAAAEHERLQEADRQRREQQRVVRTALSAVAQAWLDRTEAEAYRRFLEDYGDLELWEGHRKTLRFSYPHYDHRGLERLVQRLVEEGVQLTGLTVAAAAELARVEYGLEMEVPDDVADLVLGADTS